MKAAFWVTLAANLVANQAFADVAPPGQYECQGKSGGASCTLDGKAGTCKSQKCSRLDYSTKTDSGAPGSIQYDCVLCETSSTPSPATSSSSDAGPTTARIAENSPDAGGENNAGGCSFGAAPGAKVTTALLLVGALLFARRRRDAA